MTEHQEPSPTNGELFQDAKVFTTLEEFVTWEDPFGSDEEHEAFLADLYKSRRRCPRCWSWPDEGPPQGHRADEAAVGEWSRERVVPVTEDRRSWSLPREEPSPTNEELVRQQGVKPIESVEELFPSHDLFGSDEEHEAFLEWLHDMRRRG